MSDIVEILEDVIDLEGVLASEDAEVALETITRLTAEVEREKAYGTTMHAEWEKQREESARVKAENERLWEAKRGTDNVTSRLTAENEKLGRDYQSARDAHDKVLAENEKLRAALRECEAELNAYYRMEYPGSHPYSQKKLAQAMASNPATVALKETSND